MEFCSVFLLVALLWVSTSADYCHSSVQDCQSGNGDLADFQEMFVQYQQECDEKEYFQIQFVEGANQTFQGRYR